jgi:hypothetical protein
VEIQGRGFAASLQLHKKWGDEKFRLIAAMFRMAGRRCTGQLGWIFLEQYERFARLEHLLMPLMMAVQHH